MDNKFIQEEGYTEELGIIQIIPIKSIDLKCLIREKDYMVSIEVPKNIDIKLNVDVSLIDLGILRLHQASEAAGFSWWIFKFLMTVVDYLMYIKKFFDERKIKGGQQNGSN